MLLGETLPGGARLEYLRDAGGTAYGMIYTTAGGTRYTYYYLFDLQGNVTALVRSNGNLIATYEYDAWGRPYGVKDADGAAITSETHVARLNPYRYRGYYYDEETGFYYCGSRYYDPVVCRWLNADISYGTGQGILSYNMFAYCLNNPVGMRDGAGYRPVWEVGPGGPRMCTDVGTGGYEETEEVGTETTSLTGKCIEFIKHIFEDAKNFNIHNTDEDVVLSSHFFSAYKGVLVVRTDERSGTMDIMFLSKSETAPEGTREAVKHERAHHSQLERLGHFKYIIFIVIPSYNQWGIQNGYFRNPWEAGADAVAGIHRPGVTEEDIAAAQRYIEAVEQLDF